MIIINCLEKAKEKLQFQEKKVTKIGKVNLDLKIKKILPKMFIKYLIILESYNLIFLSNKVPKYFDNKVIPFLYF